MASMKDEIGDNAPVALSIASMGPEQRRSYVRGLYAKGDGITRQEYAASKAAEAMDSLPGRVQTYGSTTRRSIDAQVPDAVINAYRAALRDSVTKIPVQGTSDFIYIQDIQAAAPGGSVLASVLSQGQTAGARMTPMRSKRRP